MTLQQELLFDLIESEAEVNIFLDRPENHFKAKGSAIILTRSAVGHFPKRRGDKYTVWFGRGIERWTFKTFKEAVEKIASMLKMISQRQKKIVFRFEGREKRRFERELAEVI